MSKKINTSKKNIIVNEEEEKEIEEDVEDVEEEDNEENEKEEVKEDSKREKKLIKKNVEKEKKKEKKDKKNKKVKKGKKEKEDNKNKRKKKLIYDEEEEDEKEDKEKEKEKENEEDEEEEIDKEKKNISTRKNKKTKKSKKARGLLHLNQNFENDIMEAYKKLTNAYKEKSSKSTDNEDEEEDKDISESNINLTFKYCEKKLRSALRICEKDPNLIINRNIVDKLSRLSLHNKMNLNYIIGNIYISLMNKNSLFDYDDEEFEINDLLIFMNKVIQFKDTMKNTKIGINYNDTLIHFLVLIMEQFDLEEDQINCIDLILEENKDIDHSILHKSSFEELVSSLSDKIEKQPSIYEQFKVFDQNKSIIINMIKESDLEDKNNYDDYLKLGKFMAYLFYNKNFSLYLSKKNNDKEEEENSGTNYYIFDDYENKGEINVIDSEIFCVQEDENIIQLKEKLCEIIIKYVEKYIELTDVFAIQYLIYILIKRIYFCHYEKYQKKVIRLISDSLINMCFFKESPLELISSFINEILKSTKEENTNFKNAIIKNLNQVKKEKNFLYKIPKSIKLKKEEQKEEEEKKEEKDEENEEDEEDDDDIDKGLSEFNNEILLLYHKDLKIGLLNYKIINPGENFVFYEEINKDYSFLDFVLYLDDFDIKVTITDITEGKEILNKDRLDSLFETPLKVSMLFTSPRILKFEIDNSYSWIRAKTIRYKANVFYPKFPYNIGYQILISKYKKILLQTKNLIINNTKKSKKKKKTFVDNGEKLLILKIDGENKVLNCVNVKQNLEAINKMIKDKYLSVSSLYIKIKKNEKKEENNEDKSYFYYYKGNEGLIEEELKKEILEKYLNDTLSKSNANFNIFNLYLINGDINTNSHFYFDSVNELFGFEPEIKIDGSTPKIIFSIQYLNQAQLLYQLYKQVSNKEYQDIILLINYTKFGGYQVILYNNEEIISNIKDFNALNKNASIDENINIICNGINKLKEDEKNIDIVFMTSIDDKENEITPDKLEQKLMEKINENDKKYIRITKPDLEFNKELEINSHIFYVDN